MAPCPIRAAGARSIPGSAEASDANGLEARTKRSAAQAGLTGADRILTAADLMEHPHFELKLPFIRRL
ncbi:hypothetical protein D1O30_00035 [Methylocystis hirsuta]|uniref:Uncharacterized protein n=1 Tax=Methylocystis hirsuta TaxID=369798 RepID=A0A3M9XN00_9HYPH|nr:hypothetical protein D1O30_00035 [Methylocystis hirsuta]